MDDLKALLGDDLFAQVQAKLGTKVVFVHEKDQKVLIDDGKMIPKSRLDEVIEQKKGLQERMDQNDKDLKDLKKAAEGNKDLQQQIETLQKSGKDAKDAMEKREAEMKKSFALQKSLLNAGVADEGARDLLARGFDMSKIEVTDDGKIKGFDDLLKPIKENKTLAAMFGREVVAGRTPAEGGTPGEFYTREEVQAMSQEQVTANLDKVNKSVASWK